MTDENERLRQQLNKKEEEIRELEGQLIQVKANSSNEKKVNRRKSVWH